MAEREVAVKEEIKRSIEYLSKRFRIKEVILFGSQLEREADEYSDIDLIVISPDFEGMKYDEILNVFAETALSCGSRVEFHPYAEKDLLNARPANFLGYALKTGKVVFRDNKLEL